MPEVVAVVDDPPPPLQAANRSIASIMRRVERLRFTIEMSQRLQIQLGADSNQFASANCEFIYKGLSLLDCSPSLEGRGQGLGCRYGVMLRKYAPSIHEEGDR